MAEIPMKPVYFDNNATTRVDPRVVEAMLPFFTEQFGNPSSMHAFGANVSAAVNCARGELQSLLNAEHDHEIVFTSGGTESDNAAILSALEANPRRREIVTSAVEHPAILSLCAWLEKNKAVRVHVIPVDEKGRLDLDAYAAALSDRVAIVSIMWANNETGTIFPVCQDCRQSEGGRRVIPHRRRPGGRQDPDGSQATRSTCFRCPATSCMPRRASARSTCGEAYASARRSSGGHQERGRRAGTENTPAIVALGKAAALAALSMAKVNTHVRGLRDRLEQGRFSGSAIASSPAIPTTACPTPPMSHSNISKARASCCFSTRRASPLHPARPALPARSSPRMCCAP